jgi:hypothetical protein
MAMLQSADFSRIEPNEVTVCNDDAVSERLDD